MLQHDFLFVRVIGCVKNTNLMFNFRSLCEWNEIYWSNSFAIHFPENTHTFRLKLLFYFEYDRKGQTHIIKSPVRLLLTVQNNFGFPLRDFCMQKASCNYTRLFRKHGNKIYIQSYKRDKCLKNSKQYNVCKETERKRL